MCWVSGGKKGPETTYTMDPTAKLKTIDLSDGEYACLYELDGDTLKFCTFGSATRPEEFKARGKGLDAKLIIMFVRDMDEKKDK